MYGPHITSARDFLHGSEETKRLRFRIARCDRAAAEAAYADSARVPASIAPARRGCASKSSKKRIRAFEIQHLFEMLDRGIEMTDVVDGGIRAELVHGLTRIDMSDVIDAPRALERMTRRSLLINACAGRR